MKKEVEAQKSRENERRDSSKPGTIVAGPDAHARERAGKMPTGRSPKSGDDPTKKLANRS